MYVSVCVCVNACVMTQLGGCLSLVGYINVGSINRELGGKLLGIYPTTRKGG